MTEREKAAYAAGAKASDAYRPKKIPMKFRLIGPSDDEAHACVSAFHKGYDNATRYRNSQRVLPPPIALEPAA